MPPPGGDRPRRPAWQAALAAGWPALRDAVDAGLADGGRSWRASRAASRQELQRRRATERAYRVHQAALARRERVLRTERHALPTWSLTAAGAVVAAVPTTGTPREAFLAVGLLAVGRVGLAARRLRNPPPVPALPAAAQPAAPSVPARSAAAPAVRRLDAARADLQRLLPLVAPVGADAAAEAWTAGAQADTDLRWQAARLAAAEPHLGVDAGLLASLEAGVVSQEGLVHAVADLVAASADPRSDRRLQDVTERLRGLAAGLREVHGPTGSA